MTITLIAFREVLTPQIANCDYHIIMIEKDAKNTSEKMEREVLEQKY